MSKIYSTQPVNQMSPEVISVCARKVYACLCLCLIAPNTDHGDGNSRSATITNVNELGPLHDGDPGPGSMHGRLSNPSHGDPL
jgi:hypothetical protein